MDDLDRKILSLLAHNARMPVKEIAEHVSLTSPAVSSRIHKLEADGIIGGYTVVLKRPANRLYVDALISLSVAPSEREGLLNLLQNSKEVLQCYHVTGEYTFLIKVPEAGQHLHPDHPVHPGGSRAAGRAAAVTPRPAPGVPYKSYNSYSFYTPSHTRDGGIVL